MRLSLRSLAAAALCGAAMLACGGDSPTASSPVGPGTPTAPTGISAVQYMDSALSLMQLSSVNQSINWTTFRATWHSAASGLSTYAQTYPLITNALAQLDPHSSISDPSDLPGSTDAPSNRTDLQVQGKILNSAIGYLWVPGFIGKNQEGRVDTTQATLRTLDAQNPCGWIVDLRANNGGFSFALMASVGPLYAPTSGTVGGQRYADNYQILWYYKQRGTTDVFGIRDTRDSAEILVGNPWRPTRPGLPVAVLHSTARNAAGQLTSITASAGEQITLAFRGGPPTRSFGLPTYGVASGRDYFFMPDNARIDITSSYMFDRNGYTPRDAGIPPDTTIASPAPLRIGDVADPVIAAALTWVRGRPECAGAPVGSMTPSERGAPVVVPSAPDARGIRRLPTSGSVYVQGSRADLARGRRP